MGTDFYLKKRDTLPALTVTLLNPDGTVFDLTGSTGWKLHVLLADGTVRLVRTMVKVGLDTAGTLRYSWIEGDWGTGSTPDADGSLTVGGLVAGFHRMEYEVLGPLSARLTFPNNGYHRLLVVSDIGQG